MIWRSFFHAQCIQKVCIFQRDMLLYKIGFSMRKDAQGMRETQEI